MRRAKFVCTLGPASDDTETIRDLVGAGMAVARLNASHGTRHERTATLDRVADVADRTERPVATILDIPGPEVRTAARWGPIQLEVGDDLRLVEKGAVVTVDGDPGVVYESDGTGR